MDQTNIFEFIYPKYHCTKPIRLIELFAGYGSQALALKYLGVPFEHWKICEWNYKSFHAYKLLHSSDDTDYSKGLSKDELVEYLAKKGVSADWNKPMKLEQIKRLGEGSLREIYNNIQATHNLVDISQVHGNDLEIISPDQYTYIMTYSFPCQDLSLAGLRQGMNRGEETRSGLLWEVERILHELQAGGNLPDILLMENVPQVHGTGNEENFREWQLVLERMGYSNYWQDLIATDYGIPQIRNRCFMVSIKGEYCYNFPTPIPLRKRLKDLLENEVDDKYYLSEKAISWMTAHTIEQKSKGNGFKFEPTDGEGNAKTSTSRAGDRIDDNFVEIKRPHGRFPGSIKTTDVISTIDASIDFQHIVLGEKKAKSIALSKTLLETLQTNTVPNKDVSFIDGYNRAIREDDIAGTITTHTNQATNYLAIKNSSGLGFVKKKYQKFIDEKGYMPEMFNPYNEAEITDNAPTLTTQCGSVTKNSTVLIKNATKQGYLEAEEGGGVDISARMEYHRGTVQKGLSQTLSCQGGENQGVIVNDKR